MVNHVGEKRIESNIRRLFQKNPALKSVLSTLNKNSIKYGIFAGALVHILTSNREPTDVDILVADKDFNKLDTLLDGTKKRIIESDAKGDFFYLKNDSNLEFVSRLDFISSGKLYPIRLTNLAWKNTLKFNIKNVVVVLLNPVDTLLEKAISPRGIEAEKHDLEDIEALVRLSGIDKSYLKKRVEEMKAKEQVSKLLRKYKLI